MYVCMYVNKQFDRYRSIHGHFHIGLVIIPRPQYGSRDDNQANMEMWMDKNVKRLRAF